MLVAIPQCQMHNCTNTHIRKLSKCTHHCHPKCQMLNCTNVKSPNAQVHKRQKHKCSSAKYPNANGGHICSVSQRHRTEMHTPVSPTPLPLPLPMPMPNSQVLNVMLKIAQKVKEQRVWRFTYMHTGTSCYRID